MEIREDPKRFSDIQERDLDRLEGIENLFGDARRDLNAVMKIFSEGNLLYSFQVFDDGVVQFTGRSIIDICKVPPKVNLINYKNRHGS